jgi:two-component system, cell cycle response regulator
LSRDPYAPPGLEPIGEEDSSEVTMRLPIRRAAAAAPLRTPTLRVRAGRHMLQFATVRPGEPIIIGRDESADLRIPDLTVSKRHARVEAAGDGTVRLEDLGSTNGTTLDGSAIGTILLRPGDQVEVGAIGLRLDLLSDDELRHLARVVARLESANRDALTGLLNRGWMDEELPSLVERYDRAELPITCAFVDVDHFKRVNDTFSHAVGDEVLSAIARLLMLGVRDADPCVRYGGEEILLFLPGSDEAHALDASERIRASIAAHDWGRTAPGLTVTASIGVAERGRGESVRDWVDRADAALYAAKRAGRNRVFRAGRPA